MDYHIAQHRPWDGEDGIKVSIGKPYSTLPILSL
jgi:glutamate synthase domain-containing protein 1